ncbi:tyrosine-protein kinase domain-containing protein [Pararhizobium mangrovi]|nr:tyrosine-protein kinase domain-containing protein [Pararhizobium mangrovi]
MQENMELGGERIVLLLRRALRHKIVLAATALGVFAACCLVIFNLTPAYRASALLLLPSARADDPRYGTNQIPQTDPFLIASELDVLTSEEVARKVIGELDLTDAPEFNTTSALASFVGSLKHFFGGSADTPSDRVQPWSAAQLRLDSVIAAYQDRLSVYNDGRSTTAHVSFTSTNPQLAARIVNAHVQAYIDLQADRRVGSQQHVVALLTSALDKRQADLRDAELALHDFRAHKDAATTERTPAFQASEEARLVRAVDTAQSDISQTSARLEDASQALKSGILQSASFVANDAKLVSPAGVPTRKVFPRTTLFLLAGLLAASGCGFAAAVGVDVAVNRGERFRGAMQSLGLPILGSIPLRSSIFGRRSLNEIRCTEQMRFVREALLEKVDVDCPVVLVTSSMPREGKSSISLRLARSLAATGRRTLVVDADLRMARTSATLGHDKAAAGLADVLAGDVPFAEAIEFVAAESLYLMPAGTAGDVDALASHRIGDLVEQLRGHYQAIVVDSPPLVAVADAVSLARLADANLLVVRVDRTAGTTLEKSVGLLRACHVTIAGCVLTGITGQESDLLTPRERKRYVPRRNQKKATNAAPADRPASAPTTSAQPKRAEVEA